MATSLASDKPIAAMAQGDGYDPFVASTPGQSHLRHSNFDNHLFALNAGTSAEQVKRALEAHLRDTERRMEEAGKLGTALVQQRKELTERLREVEELQTEAELTPDLRQRLAEIERDFNEVAKESARAFLPKQRIPSNEAAQSSPFAPEGKGGRVGPMTSPFRTIHTDRNLQRSISPSKFESLATGTGAGSPSKSNVNNRKLRNQPNRIHDIEFAAEISTSLIAQVRNLQALLSEREEELKDVKAERSRLELEAENIHQRLKSLDESENRYKDENWNLETQIHELLAGQREAAEREKKLTQALNALQAEKNSTQRELEEVKDNLAKQDEKNAVVIKNLEIELGTSRRNAAIASSERIALQKKIEELTGQNQELAKAVSLQRARTSDRGSGGEHEDEFQTADDNNTPEPSPPPSPVKGTTPRHSHLESETLKTSLGHAHRTIQTLRTNIHREKTEKLELKRMLQDARDEIEKMRSDPSSQTNRRSRKVESKEFKKPAKPVQLGAARASKTELYFEDPEWEDQGEPVSPRSVRIPPPTTLRSPHLRSAPSFAPIVESSSDHFETANETSDAAFETAHERGTETEDFQTGAEEFSDTDEATETEATPSRGVSRVKRPSMMSLVQRDRYSFDSTASTSNDDEDYSYGNQGTPTVHPSQKMRIRASRSTLNRRSRQFSEEPSTYTSPSTSFNENNPAVTPAQSLFAELNDLSGSDEDSYAGGPNSACATPSRRSIRSVTLDRAASPVPAVPALPKPAMVDSGMMTEPVDIKSLMASPETPAMTDSGSTTEEYDDSFQTQQRSVYMDRPTSMESAIGPRQSHASTQWLGDELKDGEFSRPLSSISYSDASVQHDVDMETKLAQFPSPPTSPPRLGAVPTPILPPPQSLSMSHIRSEGIEPEAEPEVVPPAPAPLNMSAIISEGIEPVLEPVEPTPEPPVLSVSDIRIEHVEPVVESEEPAPEPPKLSTAGILSQDIEPIAEPAPPLPTLSTASIIVQDIEPIADPEPPLPTLSTASILAQDIEPIADLVVEPEPVSKPALSFSGLVSEQVEPVETVEPPVVLPVVAPAEPEKKPVPTSLSLSSIVTEQVEPLEVPASPAPRLSFSTLNTEEVEPQQEEGEPAPVFSLSVIESKDVEPVELTETPLPALSISSIQAQDVEPVELPESPLPDLAFSSIQSQDVEPLERPVTPPAALAFSTVHQSLNVSPREKPDTPQPALSLAAIESQEVEPVVVDEPAVIAPSLTVASIRSLDSEPVEPRSPKRNAFIIPRDDDDVFADHLRTPPNTDPRLESAAQPAADKPAPPHKQPIITVDQESQTALTSEAIDAMLKSKAQQQAAALELERTTSLDGIATPSTVRIHRPREESFDTPIRPKGKMLDTGVDSFDALPRRPGSAASGRTSLADALPPLPANHKEAIEAARTGSSHGASQGGMPPPLYPASALKNSSSTMLQPRTPNGTKRPMSPTSLASGRGTPTPRAVAKSESAYGSVLLHSPSRLTHPSRKSSISSFTSELDTRFNLAHGDGFAVPHGLDSNTDPRMIQAITQTMIGEYLWKYTRKAGRGEMSENRHRRYFWVHPYTRTLYWSDRDPSSAGRSELRAKSVAIEAVRVVADDNPMPPGLHRKSMVIISPGRTIKFTCTTGQRHETWFNALSYLLMRTGEEGRVSDVEDMVNGLTREDVDEFNPSVGGRRVGTGYRGTGQASLSSYNGRTVRGDSSLSPAAAMDYSVPTLTPTPKKHKSVYPNAGSVNKSRAQQGSNRPSFSTLTRISGYWRDSKASVGGTLGSIRSRSSARVDGGFAREESGRASSSLAIGRGGASSALGSNSIYEASEVPDSAEDLRKVIEAQDRESDRLENVRACCDGESTPSFHFWDGIARGLGARAEAIDENMRSWARR